MLDCFRYPTKCCTKKYTEPTMPDECRCGTLMPYILSFLCFFGKHDESEPFIILVDDPGSKFIGCGNRNDRLGI